MKLTRVGLVPTMDDPDAGHFGRSSLILSRSETDLTRYAFAAAGHMQVPVGFHRIPEIGAMVVWGSDQKQMAQAVLRFPCALMMVVHIGKVKKDGDLDTALGRVERAGSDVHRVHFTTRMKVTGYDLGANRVFRVTEDITRPPQTQHTPSIPRKEREVVISPPPTMPRKDVKPVEVSRPARVVQVTESVEPSPAPSRPVPEPEPVPEPTPEPTPVQTEPVDGDPTE